MSKMDKIFSVIAVLLMLPALIAYWQVIVVVLAAVAIVAAFMYLNYVTNGTLGWFVMLAFCGGN
jgi:hypothetical protein